MLKDIFISGINCITPLGFNVATTASSMASGISGIRLCNDNKLQGNPYYAAVIDDEALNRAFENQSISGDYSRLERMMILALEPVIQQSGIELGKRTALLISTTKGNVSMLGLSGDNNFQKAHLHSLGKKIGNHFGFIIEPIVVSNACISGILAVSVARRLIMSEIYDDVFIVAGDEVTEFVLSGFNSFQAMSNEPCKPFSKNRSGVTLGEAAAAVWITADKKSALVQIAGDGSINDANHISGPSRTGEGLFLSMKSAFEEAGIVPEQIDYISAHGTATPFNDEMEVIAFNRIGLQKTPVNSLKGYFGHTLGASGLLETVLGIHAMQEGKLYPSLGFDELGVSQSVNVVTEMENTKVRYFLKTASGFGGSNSAVIFEQINNIEK